MLPTIDTWNLLLTTYYPLPTTCTHYSLPTTHCIQVYVHDEQYLDMATAIVGSGPAYTYMFMEAMIDTGY